MGIHTPLLPAVLLVVALGLVGCAPADAGTGSVTFTEPLASQAAPDEPDDPHGGSEPPVAVSGLWTGDQSVLGAAAPPPELVAVSAMSKTPPTRTSAPTTGEAAFQTAGTPDCPDPRIETRGDTAVIHCPPPTTPPPPDDAQPPPDPQPQPQPDPEPEPEPEHTGNRPEGTGLDFCAGESEGQHQAGDYYACGSD